jgi:serine/threonine-protein kinase
MTAPETLLQGTPYRFRGVLAAGGMALVLDCDRDGRAVVVKVLRPDRVEVPSLLERLVAEARMLQRIAHPNVVAVLDCGVTPDGRAFVAMERLEGRSLRQELAARGTLAAATAVDVARQALAGLDAAHARGVVHRDVKPSNLYVCGDLDRGAVVKVIDFGIAKVSPHGALASIAPPATAPGEVFGTPWFMAPEQLRGRPVTAATDVYAMGLVLYQALTGRHPFADRTTIADVWQAHLGIMPPPPSRLAPRPLPPHLDAVVLRALAKEPRDRFDGAAAFAAALLLGMGADARQAETVVSERAPSPPVAIVTAATEVPATAAMTAVLREPPSPALPPPVAGRSSPSALRTVAIVAGALGLAWHGFGASGAASLALGPGTRTIGAGELARHGLLAACALALVLLANARPLTRARWGPRWVGGMALSIVAALAIDVAIAPVRAEEAARQSPSLAEHALAITGAGITLAALVHVAVLLIVRRWLASEPAGVS